MGRTREESRPGGDMNLQEDADLLQRLGLDSRNPKVEAHGKA